jgi:membrane associated rhomboid family serine protease
MQSTLPMDMKPTPMVLRIIGANVVLWLFFGIFVNMAGLAGAADLYGALMLSPHDATTVVGSVQGVEITFWPWQIATYAWLHDLLSPSHVLFNMLGLFFLGPTLERRWGGRPFLSFYLWSSIIAGAASLILAWLIPGVFGFPVVGASGATMAVLAAFSLVMPETTLLLFFVLPVQAKWILWIAVIMDTMAFVSGSPIAWHTHMGGVFAAWLLITGNWRPRLALDRLRLKTLNARRKRAPKLRVLPGGRGDDQMLN